VARFIFAVFRRVHLPKSGSCMKDDAINKSVAMTYTMCRSLTQFLILSIFRKDPVSGRALPGVECVLEPGKCVKGVLQTIYRYSYHLRSQTWAQWWQVCSQRSMQELKLNDWMQRSARTRI
jgi:hypothetical protein